MHFLSSGRLLFIVSWLAFSSQAGEKEAVEIAKDVLHVELGADVTSMRLRTAEAVEWSDAGLGCPQEGMSYALKTIAGYRVVLETEGKLVRVHVGDGRGVVCSEPIDRSKTWNRQAAPKEVGREQEESPVTGEVPERILDPILGDLMKRTGAERDDIGIVKSESMVWKDGALGCGRPGQEYTDAPVSGYWVILERDGERFDYRANDRGFFFLCERPSLPSAPTR